MSWLDRIVEHDAKHTVCEARAGDALPFAGADGSVPSFVAIEWMAQAMAVHGALAAAAGAVDLEFAADSEAKPQGAGALLAGMRDLRFEVPSLDANARVRIEVVHERGTRVASFACEVTDVRDRTRVAAGRLNAVIGAALG